MASARGCSCETAGWIDEVLEVRTHYPLTPRFLSATPISGSWDAVKNILDCGPDITVPSGPTCSPRCAVEINDAFLGWLEHRPQDRFLLRLASTVSMLHSPYIPPAEFAGWLRAKPRIPGGLRSPRTISRNSHKRRTRTENFSIAPHRYERALLPHSTIVSLGQLLDELNAQRILESALVILRRPRRIIRRSSRLRPWPALYLDQTAVPLVMIGPNAPAGRAVNDPVSSATLLAGDNRDQLRLGTSSPFPGYSLARPSGRRKHPTERSAPTLFGDDEAASISRGL